MKEDIAFIKDSDNDEIYHALLDVCYALQLDPMIVIPRYVQAIFYMKISMAKQQTFVMAVPQEVMFHMLVDPFLNSEIMQRIRELNEISKNASDTETMFGDV
jgi:hypothetical protein